ncbi:MAG TPA: LuxR C-terminal-related transcriptional regulator [Mycobacteriales bacterium]|nr:LuxR C-terminal-related transcriptional regulator [Mycobacteriales bacterium]
MAEGRSGKGRPTQRDADERDRAADERDRAADERDRAADERDRAADERDRAADERDRAADERDRAAGGSDDGLGRRDRRLVSRESSVDALRRRLDRFAITRREGEVLVLVMDRFTNAEIADVLYISKRTVESHVSSLMRKLGASDRGELEEVGGGPRKQA